jgi:hypothetical protein
MQNTLHFAGVKGQVFIVSKNMKICTKEHASKFFKGSNDGEHFFLHYGLILLQLQQLTREVGNWPAFLYDAGI